MNFNLVCVFILPESWRRLLGVRDNATPVVPRSSEKLFFKTKCTKSLKLLSILLEAFRDPFVTAAQAASQSSPDITNNLHKIKAVKEGLLVGKSASTPPPKLSVRNMVPTLTSR
jgi:hypothetical protein